MYKLRAHNINIKILQLKIIIYFSIIFPRLLTKKVYLFYDFPSKKEVQFYSGIVMKQFNKVVSANW